MTSKWLGCTGACDLSTFSYVDLLINIYLCLVSLYGGSRGTGYGVRGTGYDGWMLFKFKYTHTHTHIYICVCVYMYMYVCTYILFIFKYIIFGYLVNRLYVTWVKSLLRQRNGGAR